MKTEEDEIYYKVDNILTYYDAQKLAHDTNNASASSYDRSSSYEYITLS